VGDIGWITAVKRCCNGWVLVVGSVYVGCNVNRGYLCRAWGCARADWCGEGGYIESSVAYLIVEGS
jgi:hypothetical protein